METNLEVMTIRERSQSQRPVCDSINAQCPPRQIHIESRSVLPQTWGDGYWGVIAQWLGGPPAGREKFLKQITVVSAQL